MKIPIFYFLAILVIQLNFINCKFNLIKVLEKFNPKSKLNQNTKFSYQNCGPDSDSILINSLDIQPSPIQLPGVVTVSASATLKADITGPLSVQLKVIKILKHLKIEVPCINNIGSCNYEDVCKFLPSENCPGIE
jgi:ganglioside GM2 activator